MLIEERTLIERRLPADLSSPLAVYLALAELPRPFLLESVEGGQRLGRYSFLGADPRAVVRLEGERVAVEERRPVLAGGRGEVLSRSIRPAGDFLAVLRELRGPEIEPPPGSPPFCGGLVGFLGYETVNLFERLPQPLSPDLPFPTAEFGLYESAVVFDHVRQELLLLASGDRAEARLEALEARILVGGTPPPAGGGPIQGEPASTLSREAFLAGVERAKEHIGRGDIFQVILSQRFALPVEGLPPLSAYRALRRINPSPYLFFLSCQAGALIGSSPELLVRLEGRRARMRPIAGTRPRGTSPEEDLALEEELRADPKELAEHVMLVDLTRNDLGRVCRYGTVRVEEQAVVERYSHVMHLVSQVSGELRPGLDGLDLLRAVFPHGTVSGAPKVRAMEIIRDLEPARRGPYAGAVGYWSFSGRLDTAIAIRTLLMTGGMAYAQAGAGIVADSDPEREYLETVHKARALLRAVEVASSREPPFKGSRP